MSIAAPDPIEVLTLAEADRALLATDSILVDARTSSGIVWEEEGLRPTTLVIIMADDYEQAAQAASAFRRAGLPRVAFIADGRGPRRVERAVRRAVEPCYGIGA